MQSFSTALLARTLRAIAKEIEEVDPSNPALAQLRYTINQKTAELIDGEVPGDPSVSLSGAA